MQQSARNLCLLFLLFAAMRSPANARSEISQQLSSPPAPADAFTSATIPKNFFGMTVKNFNRFTPSVAYGTTRSWDGEGLAWTDLNPSPGHYNFAALDNFIARNQARGVEMIYTFGRTPQWASTKPNTKTPYGDGQCAPPSDLSAWDTFVTAIAQHAAGRIAYWELWNEPNNPEMWCAEEPGSAKVLETMAEHAYTILKKVAPSSIVLSPSVTGPQGPAWLESYLSSGGSTYSDVITFHGYSSHRAEDIIAISAKYRSILSANRIADKPLWDTEASWAAWDSDGSVSIPMASQASFLAKTYLLHRSQGIARLVWYAWDGQLGWGSLQTSNGEAGPAAEAYHQVYTWMVGATLITPCTEASDKTWRCGLSRPGQYNAEALWLPNSHASARVADRYTQYIDLAGGVHLITDHTVIVGDQPILVETGPLANQHDGVKSSSY